MARINKTQYAVLGCLSIHPMSAYEIKNFMSKTTAYFWMEHEAQLYPTLSKLHDEKFVSCKEEKAQKAGVRKIYKITAIGLEALKIWLLQPSEPETYRNEFLLKLFFSDKIHKKVVLDHIKTQEGVLKHKLKLFHDIKSELDKSDINKKRKLYIEATLSYGVFVVTAEINWCRKMKKLIDIPKTPEDAILNLSS